VNAALRAELERMQHQLQQQLQQQHHQQAAAAVAASSATVSATSTAAQALLSASPGSPPHVVLPLGGAAGLGERSLSSSSLSSHSSLRFDGTDEKQAHGSHQLQSGVAGVTASQSPALLTLTPRSHVAAIAGASSASSSSASSIFVVGRPSPSSAVRPTPPAGTASLRPIYYAPHQPQPPQPPQPPSSSLADRSVSPQWQRQMADLQRERYNAAVASGGGSSLTPRKAAAAAVVVAAAAPSHTTPPRRPEANGFHLPHAGGSPVLLTYNKPTASVRRTPR
jgi:hypothetical protein